MQLARTGGARPHLSAGADAARVLVLGPRGSLITAFLLPPEEFPLFPEVELRQRRGPAGQDPRRRAALLWAADKGKGHAQGQRVAAAPS